MEAPLARDAISDKVKTMKNLIFSTAMCAIAGLVSGCATVRDTYAPDGRKAHALNCSGTVRGWDKCYSAAGDLCKGAGYDILDRTGENAGFASVGGSGGNFGGSAVQTTERTMVIACKR